MRDPAAILCDRLARCAGMAMALLMLWTIAQIILAPKGSTQNGPPIGVLGAMGCLLAYLALGAFAGRMQQRRNRAVAASDNRGYFLYIRSLKKRDLQTVTQSGGPMNPSPNAFIVDDILEELAEATMGHGMMFIVGSKDTGSMTWSPNVILLRSTQKNWRDMFHRLAIGARAVFVIPGETPGILEELNELSESTLFHKVIVIMAPTTGRDRRRHTWTSLSRSLANHGFTLPEYRDDGLVYASRSDLSAREHCPYVIDGKRDLINALTHILKSMPTQESICMVMKDVIAIERPQP